eukprot:m.76953 g.76953  ORF g.76953 m.76953 type:complete len:551 (-) comp24958_c0_seq1:453-2105(-)
MSTVIYFECVIPGEDKLGLSLRQYTAEEKLIFPDGVRLVVVGFQTSPTGEQRELQKAGVVRLGDVVVSINGKHPKDNNDTGTWLKRLKKPYTLQFARATETLDGMICACLMPAAPRTICIPLLRNLVRRAARMESSDPLGKTGYRALCWMILLGVLSDDPTKWAAEMKRQREMYRSHAAELLKDANEMVIHQEDTKYDRAKLETALGREDHILAWDSVERDVHRTYMNTQSRPLVTYRDQLQRVLTVHAMINRGVGYVQGMNEIAGVVLEELLKAAVRIPLYQRPSIFKWEDQIDNTEADCFWLVSAIICGPCRDGFLADNDASIKAEQQGLSNAPVDMAMPSAGGGGLVARLSELQRRVRLAAPSVDKLVHTTWNLRPHIYGTRWYSVLLRREFMSDSSPSASPPEWNPQLWDCMFAFTGGNDDIPAGPWDEHRADCLLDLCCAYLTLMRVELENCRDVTGGLSILLSQRRMISFDTTEHVSPPKVFDLIAEASRVRQVRLSTEFRNQVKAGVGRALKGLFSNFQRTTTTTSSSSSSVKEGSVRHGATM